MISSFWVGFEKQAGLIKTAGVGWNTNTYTSPASTIRKIYSTPELHDPTSDSWMDVGEELELNHGHERGPGNYKLNSFLSSHAGLDNKDLRVHLHKMEHDHAYFDEKPTTNIFDTKKDAHKIKGLLSTYQKTLEANKHVLKPEEIKLGKVFLEHAHKSLKDPKIKAMSFEWE